MIFFLKLTRTQKNETEPKILRPDLTRKNFGTMTALANKNDQFNSSMNISASTVANI